MIIREECKEDHNEILKLTYEAFLTLDYPGRKRIDEHYLVSLLYNSEFVIHELCFVAQIDDEIVGHILYTKSVIMCSDGICVETITFGPLSVLPKYQNRGIGKALIYHSIEKAKELNYTGILITGVPDYYPKLGFKLASEFSITLPDGSSPEWFMGYELKKGSFEAGGVFHLLAPEYERAENDILGFNSFNKKFIQENYQYKLILRSLWEDDLPTLEKWLSSEHIRRWFEKPEDWIKEVRERYKEFSFITHLIIEINTFKVGFCQYYDCYYGQHYEDWYKVHNPEVVFSMDYLIGEVEYLKKGLGKEMLKLIEERLISIGAQKILVQPDKSNTSSCRLLESRGYVYNGSYYSKQLL